MQLKSSKLYYLYERVGEDFWRAAGFEEAPDPATACEFHLGNLQGELHKQQNGDGRGQKTVGVSFEKLGSFGKLFSDQKLTPDLILYKYSGW